MGSISQNYAYADVYREPVSLDGLAAPDADDGRVREVALSDDTHDAEDQLDFAQTQTLIQKWLNTLSARDRALIERVYWDEESQADIARSLRVSRAAISKHMTRIARHARATLAPLRGSLLLQ